MSKKTCGIIVPRQHDIIPLAVDGFFAECIRKRNHSGPHLIKDPDGKFIAWEDDWKCNCCKPEEDSRCYLYWEIKESDLWKFQ